MKRTFFLILLGASAMPAMLLADMPPPSNPPGVAAPNNAVAPPVNGPAAAPAPNVGAQPTDNVVENGAPRGPLGSLASGAPSVAEKLPAPAGNAPVGGAPAGGAPAVAGTPAVAGVPAGGAAVAAPAVAGATVNSTVATVQQTSILGQTGGKLPHEFLVMEAMGHCFFNFMQQAQTSGAPFVAGGGFPFLPPAGDLKLISVQQIGTPPGEPPMYRVSFQNLSRFAADHFHVSIIATNGRINRLSPVVSAEIAELAPNAVAHVDLRVPAAALTLGPANAPVAFDSVIVVLDSMNVLAETNEWNNVAQFVRTEIVAIEVTETATAATATVAAPAAAGVAAPATPATPGPAVAPMNPAGPATPNVAPMAAPQAAPTGGNGTQVPLEEIDEAASLLTK